MPTFPFCVLSALLASPDVGDVDVASKVPESAVPSREKPATTPKRQPRTLQRKLVVGASDDPYEREADTVAEQVMQTLRAPDGADQHQISTLAPSRISRLATVGAEGGAVDAATEQSIDQARCGGRPLETRVRRRMEGAFGTDFSGVRVHVGAQSDALNERVQARAFTTGSDIFVRRSDYAPESDAGQRLLAHELAHTVQQTGQRPANQGAQRSLQRSSGTIQRWGRARKQEAQAAKSGPRPGATDGVHGSINESAEQATGLLGGTQVGDIDSYKDDIAKANNGGTAPDSVSGKSGATDHQSAQLGIVGGSADLANMFVGISKCAKVWADSNSKAGDKAGAALEGAGSVAGGAKGLSSIVKSGTTTDTAKDGMSGAKDAASFLSGFADSVNAVKEGFFIVKGIIELAEGAAEMSDMEKFKASMEIVRRSLEAARSVVSAVKSFLDLANSGVSAAMVNTVPGLGIAMGCAELVVRGVDLVYSMIQSSNMKDSKREVKKKLGGEEGSSLKAVAQEILEKGTKKGRAATVQDKVMAQEYLTAKSLQYVNDKRSRRALLKISIAMAKIAGDAATLGGVSAPAGIGLKVGAVAVDIGAGIFRKFKQWARDKVAESEGAKPAGAKKGFLAKIFNTEKSTANKTLEYSRIIDNVLDMIVKATPSGPRVTPAQRVQMTKVESYVSAMGFSMVAMEREAKAGPGKLYEKMLEALKKRE